MATLNKAQQAIAAAFAQYKEGSTAVVRSFEQAISDFWLVDRCRCDNLTFFINAAKRWPVLQKTAINILKFSAKDADGSKGFALGYFDVKLDKKTGEWVVTNKEGITKEMKLAARQNVRAFLANEYTSLMNVKGIKLDVAFDLDKSASSIKASLTSALRKMLEDSADADPRIMEKLAASALAEVFSDAGVAKVKAEIAKKKAA